MRRSWLISTLVASIIIILGSTTIASATINTAGITPYYANLKKVYVMISKASNSSAKVWGFIEPKSVGRHTSITVKLQKKEGNTWKTVGSWSGDNKAGIANVGATKSVSSGVSYRAYAEGRVFDNSGKVIETATKYSNTITF